MMRACVTATASGSSVCAGAINRYERKWKWRAREARSDFGMDAAKMGDEFAERFLSSIRHSILCKLKIFLLDTNMRTDKS